MPRFPGCENKATLEEKKACAREELDRFIYKNLVYPEEALQAGLEGTCVISFIIEKDGSIDCIAILKDPGAGMGDAAAAAIGLMNEQGIKWTPQRSRSRPVRIQFNVPVNFRLPKEEGDHGLEK